MVKCEYRFRCRKNDEDEENVLDVEYALLLLHEIKSKMTVSNEEEAEAMSLSR